MMLLCASALTFALLTHYVFSREDFHRTKGEPSKHMFWRSSNASEYLALKYTALTNNSSSVWGFTIIDFKNHSAMTEMDHIKVRSSWNSQLQDAASYARACKQNPFSLLR